MDQMVAGRQTKRDRKAAALAVVTATADTAYAISTHAHTRTYMHAYTSMQARIHARIERPAQA